MFFKGASNNSFLKVAPSTILPYNMGEISLLPSDIEPMLIPANEASPFKLLEPVDFPLELGVNIEEAVY